MSDLTFGGTLGPGIYCPKNDKSMGRDRCIAYGTCRCINCKVQGRYVNYTTEPADLEEYGGQ